VKKISIFDAEPGMILAKPVTVLHTTGRELMQTGHMLQKRHIKKLNQWGIEYIYIETYDSEDPIDFVFSDSIRLLAKQTYEDAIVSLTRLSKLLLSKGECDISEAGKTVSQIMDVIAMEHGLLSLLSKLKETEEYIYQHCVDVSVVSLILARAMDYTRDELQIIGTAALLHDIGLVRYKRKFWDNSMIQHVPTSIRKHPSMSREVAKKIDEVEPRILDIVAQHHEYMDGSGYPAGIKGAAIDELARIVCISEVYCHMVSPLDPAHSINPHDAVGVILDPRFNRFDPRVLRAFIANMAIYPAGTFVQMNNFVRGVVLSSNVDKPMRPKVLVLYDDESKPVKPFPVDLSDPKYADWYIEKVIPGQDITRTLGKLLRI